MFFRKPDELKNLENSQCPFSQSECPYRQFPPMMPPPPPQPGGQQGSPPIGPPPASTPKKSAPQVKSVDPGAIRPCTNRYVYIWLRNRRSFWAYLTYVGRTSASGWRWNGFRWIYFGIDLKKIDSFICF